jgi:apolipoprotein N-acyltransferase
VPENVSTTTTGTIELRDDRTLYVRWGDWWPIVCLVVSALMFLYARFAPRTGPARP